MTRLAVLLDERELRLVLAALHIWRAEMPDLSSQFPTVATPEDADALILRLESELRKRTA